MWWIREFKLSSVTWQVQGQAGVHKNLFQPGWEVGPHSFALNILLLSQQHGSLSFVESEVNNSWDKVCCTAVSTMCPVTATGNPVRHSLGDWEAVQPIWCLSRPERHVSVLRTVMMAESLPELPSHSNSRRKERAEASLCHEGLQCVLPCGSPERFWASVWSQTMPWVMEFQLARPGTCCSVGGRLLVFFYSHLAGMSHYVRRPLFIRTVFLQGFC